DLTQGHPVFGVLEHFCGVDWHPIAADARTAFSVAGAQGLSFTAVPLKSKPPPYSPHRNEPRPGDNIGLRVVDLRTRRSLFYAPGLGEIEPHLRPFLAEADCLMLDGTFWTEDELIQLGVSAKRAADMGHLPQSGPGGMVEVLAKLAAPRKVLIHINNTNPILDEDSPERAALRTAGIEVAFDGMEIEL
ncbi:MAG TPA: MBL fold metallo-hydrolase, partial [Steroidobacteraceae bacterium]